jgi:hypothetical protein
MMRKNIFITLSLLALVFACNKKPTMPDDDKPPSVRSIELTKDDVGVTDAWLRVKFLDSLSGSSFKLTRNGQTIFIKTITKLDTFLLDTGLLPSQTYNYRVYRLRMDREADSSSVVTLTTMDTTSHNFTWQVDTISTGSTCVVNDVFIVNDTCVYIVGQFNESDSLGKKKGGVCGAGVWDGKKWKTIKLYDEQNDIVVPIRGITVFGTTDFWLAAGSVNQWDGLSSQTQESFINYLLPEPFPLITKLWGISSNDLYGVGSAGTIIHFNGFNWQIHDVENEVQLTDIWGSPRGGVVWASGYYTDQPGTYLFKYDGSNWRMAYDGTNSRFSFTPDSISGIISTVWTNSNKKVFVGAGAGIFLSEANANWKSRLITPFGWLRTFPKKIRGNDINDMFIVGTYNFIGHYNGMTSKVYSQFLNYSNQNHIYSVAQKGNLVVAVGYSADGPISTKAVVYIGRR